MTYAQEATAESRTSTGTNVIAGILAYLQDRRLQPGDRLPSERDLAERLGVGRNGVREALSTLVTLRVIESRPNSGIYLRHMSRESSFEALVLLTDIGAMPAPTEVMETMEVRAHLELLAVGLACQRRTEEDLARMEAILTRTAEILEIWRKHRGAGYGLPYRSGRRRSQLGARSHPERFLSLYCPPQLRAVRRPYPGSRIGTRASADARTPPEPRHFKSRTPDPAAHGPGDNLLVQLPGNLTQAAI